MLELKIEELVLTREQVERVTDSEHDEEMYLTFDNPLLQAQNLATLTSVINWMVEYANVVRGVDGTAAELINAMGDALRAKVIGVAELMHGIVIDTTGEKSASNPN